MLVLQQNADADLPRCNADDKGENDRGLVTSDTKNPTAQPGIRCQIEFRLIQVIDPHSNRIKSTDGSRSGCQHNKDPNPFLFKGGCGLFSFMRFERFFINGLAPLIFDPSRVCPVPLVLDKPQARDLGHQLGT